MKLFLILFTIVTSLGSYTSFASDRSCTFRPHRCRFFPSKDIRTAISIYEDWNGEKKPYMERLAFEEIDSVDKIESECETAVMTYGNPDSVDSCFDYEDDQMQCMRIFRGYCEW